MRFRFEKVRGGLDDTDEWPEGRRLRAVVSLWLLMLVLVLVLVVVLVEVLVAELVVETLCLAGAVGDGVRDVAIVVVHRLVR